MLSCNVCLSVVARESVQADRRKAVKEQQETVSMNHSSFEVGGAAGKVHTQI